MKILLIEDNILKREKVVTFIETTFPEAAIESAASYNAGLSLALSEDFTLLILDMSLPTFDKTQNNRGGRFRVFGGREIAQRLKRAGKLTNFVILTGYKDFVEDAEKLTLEQVSEKLYALSDAFLGVILYESSSSKWKSDISEAIKALRK